jgi:hypothetical protein
MMDLLGATVGREVAQECPCKTAIALLVRLGAVHTAKMHAKGAAENPDQWSEQDWGLHMLEEEKLFFPLLPAHVSRQFVQEHELFRQEFKKFGKIKSLDVLKAHSARENMWAEKLLMESDAHVGVEYSVTPAPLSAPVSEPVKGPLFPTEEVPASEQAKPEPDPEIEPKLEQEPKPSEPKKSGFKLEPTPGVLLAGFGILLGLGFLVTGFIQRRFYA